MKEEFSRIITYFRKISIGGATPQKIIFLLKIPLEEFGKNKSENDLEKIEEYIRKTKKIDHLIIKSNPIPFNVKNYYIPFDNIDFKIPKDIYEYLLAKFQSFLDEKIDRKVELVDHMVKYYLDDFWNQIEWDENYGNTSKQELLDRYYIKKEVKVKPKAPINDVNKYLSKKTLESDLKPLFKGIRKDDFFYFTGICYFSEWTSQVKKVTFVNNSILEITSEIFEYISLEAKENTIDFDNDSDKCVNYPKWLSDMIEDLDLDKLNVSQKQIQRVNLQLNNNIKKEIITFMKEMAKLKNDAKENGVTNEEQKKILLFQYEKLFEEILSDENYDKIYNGGMKTKIEDILNYLLSDNLWILGYYGDSGELVTKTYTNSKWKPDIIIKNKDGRNFVYELKRADVDVIHWDSSHKSYYLSAACNQAIAQIENQHQFLIQEAAINGDRFSFTKNDQLFIIIGNYQNELDPSKFAPSEKSYYSSEQEIIETRKAGIQLIRNKFKNAHIIFYDELEKHIN